MRIKIQNRNLTNSIAEAIKNGASDNLEVLFEIAKRHPEAVFYREAKRKNKVKVIEFTSQEMLICKEGKIEMRVIEN